MLLRTQLSVDFTKEPTSLDNTGEQYSPIFLWKILIRWSVPVSHRRRHSQRVRGVANVRALLLLGLRLSDLADSVIKLRSRTREFTRSPVYPPENP